MPSFPQLVSRSGVGSGAYTLPTSCLLPGALLRPLFPQTSVGSTGQRSSQMPQGQKGTWVESHLCQGYPCDLGQVTVSL